MLKGRHTPIAILDIGTTKIVCFIAKLQESGRPEIIGIGHQLSEGIKAGLITNIKSAEQTILEGVDAAELMAKEKIDKVVVNFSGAAMASNHYTAEQSISGGEVTRRDIKRLKDQALSKFRSKEQEVLHTIPISYSIDGNQEVDSPVSMVAKHLSSELHVITYPSNNLVNWANCLTRCELDIEDGIIAPYASGIACLTKDEKDLGVTLIDMGGGTTSIAVFKEGRLHHVASIPVGGLHVTKDIACGLSTSLTVAERIKTLHGNVISAASDQEEMLSIPGIGEQEEDEEYQFTRAELVEIIRPRIEETFELVKEELAKVPGGTNNNTNIVLTGGACQLMGMKNFVSKYFNKPVRLGKPKSVKGLADSTSGYAFATALGMLHYVANKEQKQKLSQSSETPHPVKKWLKTSVHWLKENF